MKMLNPSFPYLISENLIYHQTNMYSLAQLLNHNFDNLHQNKTRSANKFEAFFFSTLLLCHDNERFYTLLLIVLSIKPEPIYSQKKKNDNGSLFLGHPQDRCPALHILTWTQPPHLVVVLSSLFPNGFSIFFKARFFTNLSSIRFGRLFFLNFYARLFTSLMLWTRLLKPHSLSLIFALRPCPLPGFKYLPVKPFTKSWKPTSVRKKTRTWDVYGLV